MGTAAGATPDSLRLRVAAVGDLHCRPALREQIAATLGRAARSASLILLAGDLTTHGAPEQAAVLADACRPLQTPVVAVLGNHDWHSSRAEEVVEAISDAGVVVLERQALRLEVAGIEVGVVGLKGFVGGFGECQLPDFGEPLLRRIYAESSADVAALAGGLAEIVDCQVRVALLHYSPTASTLEGEPPGIWAFLGSERLAAPLMEHRPDLVVHGHAHAGRFEGRLPDGLQVYNVSAPLLPDGFHVFELPAGASTHVLG